MSLERANEMVKFLKNLNEERTNAGETTGFKSRELYDVGMTYGVSNMEMLQTFLGKRRAISRGRYLPDELDVKQVQSAKPSKGTRKRKATPTMDSVVAAVQASKNFTPSARKVNRLAMIKEMVLRKEAEAMAETATEDFSDKEEKSFDKGDSPEESSFEFAPIAPKRADVEEEFALLETYI